MLMARVFQPCKVRGTFLLCSLLLVLVAVLPSIGGAAWRNGLFEAFCVIVVFPSLVWLGASENALGEGTSKVCSFLGDLSYPLYMVHYPLFYLYYNYLGFDGNGVSTTFKEAWPVALLVVASSLLIAWICMKFYDKPLRRRLLSD